MTSPHLRERERLIDDLAAANAAREAILRDPKGPWLRLKVAVYRKLFPGEGDSNWLDSSIIVLIAANIVAVVLETDADYANAYMGAFIGFEWFSSVVFSIEYALRLWVADLVLDPRHPWRSRLRYARSFMALVDLLALIPFYLPMLVTIDLRFVRAVRLLRIVRVLKMGRYAEAIFTLFAVFRKKQEQLAMASFILALLLIVSASAIYFVEHQTIFEVLPDGTTRATVNPEDPFHSIPSSMWWAVVTLTTVGYGDVVPQTALGKLIAAMVALLGVGFVAIPTGIIAAGFTEQLEDDKGEPTASPAAPTACPHCGKALHPAHDPESTP